MGSLSFSNVHDWIESTWYWDYEEDGFKIITGNDITELTCNSNSDIPLLVSLEGRGKLHTLTDVLSCQVQFSLPPDATASFHQLEDFNDYGAFFQMKQVTRFTISPKCRSNHNRSPSESWNLPAEESR